jgi:hypothetical protein
MTANKQTLTISYINHEILSILFLHMRHQKCIFMLSEILYFVTKPTFLKRTLGKRNSADKVRAYVTCHSQRKKKCYRAYVTCHSQKKKMLLIAYVTHKYKKLVPFISTSATATKANTPQACYYFSRVCSKKIRLLRTTA